MGTAEETGRGDAAGPSRGQAGRLTGAQRFSIWEFNVLIAGLALGIWLCLSGGRVNQDPSIGAPGYVLILAAGVLGGLSLVGVPLLLGERFRYRRRWGPGKLLWFASGTSAWLLWPPMIHHKVRGQAPFDTMSGVCFAYGTPLMALYVTAALLAGGWIRRRRRRRSRARARSWRESFGLFLGLAWACTGLYVLSLLYHDDFFK
ncbi:MAG: hypothetical protein U0835_09300 [Isosphaeraceae bacterium]